MGENPCVSDGKQFTSSLMEDADNLSENVDAGIKISRPFISHSAIQTPFWKLVVGRDCREPCGRDRLKKIYLIILVINGFVSILNNIQREFECSSEGKRRKKELTPNFEKEMNIYRRKEVRRRSKEKNKQNEKDNTRKWHIFVLTGRFCCYFTQQVCLLNKHKSLYSPPISKKVNISVRRQNEEWQENFCCFFFVFI